MQCLVSLQEERTERHREKKVTWRWRQRLELCYYKPRHAWGHQKLERPGKILLWGLQSKQVWPCWHLDFQLLGHRTTSQLISVVLSHPISWNFVTTAPGKVPQSSGSHSFNFPQHVDNLRITLNSFNFQRLEWPQLSSQLLYAETEGDSSFHWKPYHDLSHHRS